MLLLVLIAENSNIDNYYLRVCITSNQFLGEERLDGWLCVPGEHKDLSTSRANEGA